MGTFFKKFGMGILYVVICPFTLVVLGLFSIVGVVIFFCEVFKGIFLFFTGRSLSDDLEEDIKAKEILAKMHTPQQPIPSPAPAPQSMSIYPSDSSMYTSNYHGMSVEQKQTTEDNTNDSEDTEIHSINKGENDDYR